MCLRAHGRHVCDAHAADGGLILLRVPGVAGCGGWRPAGLKASSALCARQMLGEGRREGMVEEDVCLGAASITRCAHHSFTGLKQNLRPRPRRKR